MDDIKFWLVDGKPAMTTPLLATKLVNGEFVGVTPSSVRAEGVEVTEEEFNAAVEATKGK